MKYRVVAGKHTGQIVTIKTKNGSAVRVATIGVPLVEFWTSRKNLEPVTE